MKTKQLYLEDSYLKEMSATVLEVVQEDVGKHRILLDQTIFYAMGGGQPTDQGVLSTDDWSAKVYQVVIKDGELWQYINSESAPPITTKIHGEIDWERRFKNMRKHSAGHIIDFALYALGYSPKQLQPLKGDHGKKAYIQYRGILDIDITQQLQEKANELVEKNLALSCEFVEYDQLRVDALYLQPNLPTNKPLRALTLESVGTVADGGTQVANTGEVGVIEITSVVSEGEHTIIKYSLK